MKTKKIKLGPTEYVVVAYALPADGPGWCSRPLWVVICDGASGKMREHCVQPEDQTDEMHTLYRVSSTVTSEMNAAVRRVVVMAKR